MGREEKFYMGLGESPRYLELRYGNRHGLIAGATGTGKTVTLQVMAEGFCRAGVPVFMADIKGDLSGISQEGSANPNLIKRAEILKLTDYSFQAFPVVFWDLLGKMGHPVRTTVSDMGPLLLSRLMNLNDTQEGVLNVAFKVADDQGLLLLDLKDLRSLLTFVADNAKKLTTEYGTVRKVSIGAILRRLLMLQEQGGNNLFGEPALDLNDFMRTDSRGLGYINILASEDLMMHPRLYSTFMLWLMSELFEELPEIGDPDKPKLVFFFDEAHLLFKDAPRAMVDKVEQVVRLIRSKGVGVFFITQNPLDIPDSILGQLGNRVQHALRAFTPRDQKAVRTAADTFRSNPKLNAAEAITELEVGEALVSTLAGKGVPTVVERTLIRPPSSRIGPATDAERSTVISRSPVSGKYDTAVDRHSAYEELKTRAEKAMEAQQTQEVAEAEEKAKKKSGKKSSRMGFVEAFSKSILRSAGSAIGRQIVRGVLGSLLKGK